MPPDPPSFGMLRMPCVFHTSRIVVYSLDENFLKIASYSPDIDSEFIVNIITVYALPHEQVCDCFIRLTAPLKYVDISAWYIKGGPLTLSAPPGSPPGTRGNWKNLKV